MPIANLLILEGRTAHDKQELIRAVTAAIVDTLEVKPESVRVIVHEVQKENWGIGGVSARELGK
jgi:4-oxalocrotonate tautomerase